MKKVMFATAMALVALSCENKNETDSTMSQSTTTSSMETSTTSQLTPQDSAMGAQEPAVVAATENNTTKSTTGNVYNYVSDDGKTKFQATYDIEKGTASVKNETTGKTYEMKNVVSGSGSKYQDKDGNFFWTHQGEFIFGKGDTDEITGKEVK